jgi:hypothetical protein
MHMLPTSLHKLCSCTDSCKYLGCCSPGFARCNRLHEVRLARCLCDELLHLRKAVPALLQRLQHSFTAFNRSAGWLLANDTATARLFTELCVLLPRALVHSVVTVIAHSVSLCSNSLFSRQWLA